MEGFPSSLTRGGHYHLYHSCGPYSFTALADSLGQKQSGSDSDQTCVATICARGPAPLLTGRAWRARARWLAISVCSLPADVLSVLGEPVLRFGPDAWSTGQGGTPGITTGTVGGAGTSHSPGPKVKVAQLCPTLCDPRGYIVRGILQARISELCTLPLLQGIFPTQGSNLGLPHCRWISYQLSRQGN